MVSSAARQSLLIDGGCVFNTFSSAARSFSAAEAFGGVVIIAIFFRLFINRDIFQVIY